MYVFHCLLCFGMGLMYVFHCFLCLCLGLMHVFHCCFSIDLGLLYVFYCLLCLGLGLMYVFHCCLSIDLGLMYVFHCQTYILNCLKRLVLGLMYVLQLWLDILFTVSPLNQHVNIILLSTFFRLKSIYFSPTKAKTYKNTTNFSPQSRESWCINTSGCHMTIQDIAINLNPCKVSLMRRVTRKWFSVPSWGGRG